MDKIYITAAVSIGLWVLTLWIQMARNYLKQRKERLNLVHVLFYEIDFIRKDLLFFIEKSVDLKQLEPELRNNPSLIPHVTDAQYRLIYMNNIRNLHYIDDQLIKRIIIFYGLLNKLKGQIDGLNAPSFSTISAKGKYKVLCNIWDHAIEIEKIGSEILTQLSKQYKKLNLAQQFRSLKT